MNERIDLSKRRVGETVELVRGDFVLEVKIGEDFLLPDFVDATARACDVDAVSVLQAVEARRHRVFGYADVIREKLNAVKEELFDAIQEEPDDKKSVGKRKKEKSGAEADEV